MEFGSPLYVWDTANLCFFDNFQPVIAQFDPVVFAFWQKKEKKTYNNRVKRWKYGFINSPRCPGL